MSSSRVSGTGTKARGAAPLPAAAATVAGAVLLAQRVLQDGRLLRRVVDQLDLAIGHQAGHEDLAALGNDLEQPVPDALHAFGQTTGEEEENEEQPDPGEHQLVLGEGIAQHLDQPDPHEHAADGAQAADDGHGEHHQPVRRVVGVEGHCAQQHRIEAARDAGDGARQHEAGQLGADRRHRHGGSRLLVVAGRQEDAPRPGPAQPLNEEDGQHQKPQAAEVEGLVGGQVEALPQHRAQECLGNDAREVRRIEEEGVHRHPQRERDRGQVGAADAQGRDPHHHGEGGTGHAGRGQAQEEVRVRLLDQVTGQHSSDAGEGELAQAHVARPAREDDKRDGDDPVDERRRVLERRARPRHERDHHDDHPDEGQDADPSRHDLGQRTQRSGDGLEDAGRRERLLGVVGPAPLALQEEQTGEDRHQVHHVADRTAVARHVELEEPAGDAEGHAGAEGERQALHAGDDGGRQRGQNERRAGPGRDGDAGRGCAEDARQARQQAGDHPDQGGEPAHRNAQQPGPVRVVGHRAHGDAGVGAQEEPAQGDEHDGDDDGDEEVVPVEEHREDQHVLRAERRGDAAHDGGAAQPSRDEQLDPPEELRQADGDHHDDQPRCGEEAPTDDEVDEEAQRRPHQEGDPDADEPVDMVGQVQLDGDRGRQRAHGAVGEVDDP